MKMNRRRTELTPPIDGLEATARRVVVYTCVSIKRRELENAKRDLGEIILKGIWQDIHHVAWAWLYGRI